MTGDKKINFYLKKFLSIDQAEDNFFNYLQDRFADVIKQTWPDSGLWSPYPCAMTSGANDTVTLNAGAAITCQDNAGRLIEVTANAVPFANVNTTPYYVGAKFIEIPDELETNPRYNTPQWKLLRDAVGEIGVPDSVSDLGGGTYRFVVNSVLESGEDNSGRTCRLWIKEPTAIANAYVEKTVSYAAGDNYIDVVAGTDLQGTTLSTTAADYGVAVEGITISTTDLSLSPEYVFFGIITGNGPAATPVAFNITGQTELLPSGIDITALTTAFQAEHNYSPGSGDHSAITADSLDGKTGADLAIGAEDDITLTADGSVIVTIDADADEADQVFKVAHDSGPVVDLFSVGENGDVRALVDANAPNANSLIRRDYMFGHFLSWKYGLAAFNASKSSITVGKGAAIIGEDYVEIVGGAGVTMTVNAGTIYSAGATYGRRSGDSWSADTWYFIYITKDWGTPPAAGIAYSSTAPNNIWYHPSDSNWRCIGAFKTDSTPEVLDFWYLADGTCYLGLWDYGNATPALDHNLMWSGGAASTTWTQISSDGTLPIPANYFPTIAGVGIFNFWSASATPTNFRWRPYNVGYWRTNQPTDFDSGIPFLVNPINNNDLQIHMPLGQNRDAEFEQIGVGTTRIGATGYKVDFSGPCPLL